MRTKQPACIDRCSRCYYHKLNKCIAQEGDDFYIPIDDSEKDEKYIKRMERNSTVQFASNKL